MFSHNAQNTQCRLKTLLSAVTLATVYCTNGRAAANKNINEGFSFNCGTSGAVCILTAKTVDYKDKKNNKI